MPIWLAVNLHSGVPLYIQLVEQIKRAIQVGVLRPGDPLPTMRQIAAELHIALNTIVKAYAELEAQGLIETRAGAGTVVAAGVDSLLKRQAIEHLRQRLREVASDAAALGVSAGELRDWFDAEARRAYPLPTDDTTRREG